MGDPDAWVPSPFRGGLWGPDKWVPSPFLGGGGGRCGVQTHGGALQEEVKYSTLTFSAPGGPAPHGPPRLDSGTVYSEVRRK